MGKLIAILTIALLASCGKQLPVAPITLTDSTTTMTTHTHAEYFEPLPADTALVAALFKCDSLGNVYLAQIQNLQGQRVKQDVTVTNGLIAITATDAATQKTVSTTTDSTKVTIKEIPVPYPVEVTINVLKWWQKYLMYIGALVVTILPLWLCFKLKLNPIKPLIKWKLR